MLQELIFIASNPFFATAKLFILGDCKSVHLYVGIKIPNNMYLFRIVLLPWRGQDLVYNISQLISNELLESVTFYSDLGLCDVNY